MSDTLRPHEMLHARLPCSPLSPRVCSNSCQLSQWCYPTILSSVSPFSSCTQSFPELGSFSSESVLHIRWPVCWSFSFSISPSNEHPGLISFRMNWLDLLSVQGTLESSSAPQFKSISSSVLSLVYSPTLTSIHDYWKTMALTRLTFVGKVMSLLFNVLSRFVIDGFYYVEVWAMKLKDTYSLEGKLWPT